MDEHAVAARSTRGGLPLTLRVGSGRYPIIADDAFGCLIRVPDGARLRGFADIYEGEQHRAHCLIVLAAPDGGFVRATFKRRSPVLAAAPPDFARD
jgi:hypothetical protein